MKIQALNSATKKPLINTKIQLQVKGKDAGYPSCLTDAQGYFELNDKYEGQQIAYFLQGNIPTAWIKACEGAILNVDTSLTALKKGQVQHETGAK